MLFSILPTTLLFTTALSHHHNIRSPDVIQWAPVPDITIGPTIPSIGYYIEPYGEGAYTVMDGAYQSMFFVSDQGVIVIDAPPTLGQNLLYAIGNTTDIPVTHFIYSHSHADHTGGASLFDDGKVVFIAHEETLFRLSQVPDPLRPLPSVTFEKDKTLQIGNQTLELSYKGPNHEPGNIFIYAPNQKVLMLIDVIYPGWVPFTQLAVSENIPGWIEAHDQILEYEFDHLVSGHVTRTGNRDDVIVQKEYVMDLMGYCRDAITNSTAAIGEIVGGAVAANPGNSWAPVKVYSQWTADMCAERMNEKWVGRLGGADVFAHENANKMIDILRLDYGFLGPFSVV